MEEIKQELANEFGPPAAHEAGIGVGGAGGQDIAMEACDFLAAGDEGWIDGLSGAPGLYSGPEGVDGEAIRGGLLDLLDGRAVGLRHGEAFVDGGEDIRAFGQFDGAGEAAGFRQVRQRLGGTAGQMDEDIIAEVAARGRVGLESSIFPP